MTGDTILERPEMQKLLAAVETGQYAGVLVMEVPRLARGNTRDQGIVAETFQYSGCKIITPEKLYDPANESDEEYFEFGLFMSRREYKTINRRLGRGRMASLQEGKYIASCAPYGYEKYKLPRQKGYSLRIVPQEAEIVRHIFSLYTGNGSASGPGPLGSAAVADQLNREGVASPGGVSWSAHTVRDILKNPVYCGLVRWSYRPASKKVVRGQVTVCTPVSKTPTIVQGLHEPIISQTQFQQAQEQLRRSFHAPVPGTQPLRNPLAGLIFCCRCGRAMVQQKDSRSGFATGWPVPPRAAPPSQPGRISLRRSFFRPSHTGAATVSCGQNWSRQTRRRRRPAPLLSPDACAANRPASASSLTGSMTFWSRESTPRRCFRPARRCWRPSCWTSSAISTGRLYPGRSRPPSPPPWSLALCCATTSALTPTAETCF